MTDSFLFALDTPTAYPTLAALGWDAARTADFGPHASDAVPARVTRVDRGGADLLGATGTLRASYGREVLASIAGDRSAGPTTGDWCAVRAWPDGRITVEAVLPRRTAVVRRAADRTSHGQVLAANVDVVAVVEHLDPEPDLGRIERLLVLAWSSGATPLVVLTKADLVRDAEWLRADVAAAAPGADVVTVAAASGQGVDDVRARIDPGATVVLLGPSGAGKSTLTNALAGADVMAVSRLRADGKGRHTTSHRELVLLPDGGVVLDTPGLRAVGLVADDDALASAFTDIEDLAGSCRFRDCTHEVEPGCAVLEAMESGELELRRLDSWRKLGREARYQAMRTDARLRAEVVAGWKQRHKEMRRYLRDRPGGWRR